MSEIIYRDAIADDLPDIVALMADDPLGRTCERAGPPLDPAYRSAFDAIDRDPNHRLVVAVDGGRIVGTFQLSFIPGLGRMGSWRGQIEAVRVASDRRNERLGEALMLWALERCRERGCSLVQLTTDPAAPTRNGFTIASASSRAIWATSSTSPPLVRGSGARSMNLYDQILRYFSTSDLASVPPKRSTPDQRMKVDLGLTRDRGERFALWALLHSLGPRPISTRRSRTKPIVKLRAISWT